MTSVVRSLVRAVRRLVMLPTAPRPLMAFVTVFRLAGVLRGPRSRRADQIRAIFVSHPYSSLGDMVLLLPLLEQIRAEWPEAALDVAVGTAAAPLLDGIQGIRHIFRCGSHSTGVPRFGRYVRLFQLIQTYRTQIMGFEYDLAIAPRWGTIMTLDAVFMAYLTGAPRRIGYSSCVDHGWPRLDSMLTTAVNGGWHEHETTRNLRLLERAGLVPIGSPECVDQPVPALARIASHIDQGSAEKLDSEISAAPGYIVISPGATKPTNLWPADRLAEVVRELNRVCPQRFYIVGSVSDAQRCDAVAKLVPECAISLAGKTSLSQLIGLLAKAALFIGMDSGTAHIAGGLGIPTIVLFPFPSTHTGEHPASPVRFRPCGPRVRVLQPREALAPCVPTCALHEPHCILQIRTEDVILAAGEFLNQEANARG